MLNFVLRQEEIPALVEIKYPLLLNDEWIETTPLPAKNVFFGCCSIDDKIYVISGTVGGNPDWESYPAVYEGTVIYD